MPTTLIEFIDDTTFERYVLDRATPLLPRSPGTSVIELGELNSAGISIGLPPATVRVGMTDSAGSAGDQLSADDIRPLLFGAAWKVLDQLIELALEQAGVPHDRRRDYSVTFKAAEAANGRVAPVPPFASRPDLWLRVITTYASTGVLRNSLTHRRLIVDPATGDINGVARPGEPAPAALTVAQQLAFCQVAVGAAQAAMDGKAANPPGRTAQLDTGPADLAPRTASIRRLASARPGTRGHRPAGARTVR
ncbi:MAG TPA: hypothetical protein VMA73_01280 [Streptosporangiaceae bacterium]|nr:hypothetical protein [Streptosporangiaceae bacterium]